MPLGVGLVSAVLLNKKRPGYKTRLQKLAAKLQKQPLTNQKFFEIPVKKIVIIIFITVFIATINWIETALKQQIEGLRVIDLNSGSEEMKINNEQVQKQRIQQALISLSTLTLDKQNNIITEADTSRKQISSVFFWMRIVYLVAIFCLILQLQIKILSVSNTVYLEHLKLNIKETKIHLLPFSCKQKLLSQFIQNQGTQKQFFLHIVERGHEKFTHYNSYYSIQLIFKNESGLVEEQIIRRAHIFDARKTLIQICSIVGIAPDLKIYGNSKKVHRKAKKN